MYYETNHGSARLEDLGINIETAQDVLKDHTIELKIQKKKSDKKPFKIILEDDEGFKKNAERRRKLENDFINDFDQNPKLRLNYKFSHPKLAVKAFEDDLFAPKTPRKAPYGHIMPKRDYADKGSQNNLLGKTDRLGDRNGHNESPFGPQGGSGSQKINQTVDLGKLKKEQKGSENGSHASPPYRNHTLIHYYKTGDSPAAYKSRIEAYDSNKIFRLIRRYNRKTNHNQGTEGLSLMIETPANNSSGSIPSKKIVFTSVENMRFATPDRRQRPKKGSKDPSEEIQIRSADLDDISNELRAADIVDLLDQKELPAKMLHYPYPQILVLDGSPLKTNRSKHLPSEYTFIEVDNASNKKKERNYVKIEARDWAPGYKVLIRTNPGEETPRYEEVKYRSPPELVRHLKMKWNVYNYGWKGEVWERLMRGEIVKVSGKEMRRTARSRYEEAEMNQVRKWNYGGGKDEELRYRLRNSKDFSEVLSQFFPIF